MSSTMISIIRINSVGSRCVLNIQHIEVDTRNSASRSFPTK